MDVAEEAERAEAAGPAPRQARWLTRRAAVLALAVLAVGSVAGVRVVERLDRPAAGDRYEVAYEGDQRCASVRVRVDGLALQGSTDRSLPPVTSGTGTLVLDRVWDLPINDGQGVHGVLTLPDGTELEMSGGTEGKVFFTLGCAIGN
jgi:hypothetical protein